MLTWIMANLGTILISLALILMVTGAIFTLIRDKKNGKSCCGGNCAHCKGCAAAKAHEKQ
ncbi:MAG: FeoB-associated Cys-rich membrane protein [Lachnospiraceae bacterium]|nr:FeoB-associated Cys-rich membrane protein [Lachnospiraceae bacterium]